MFPAAGYYAVEFQNTKEQTEIDETCVRSPGDGTAIVECESKWLKVHRLPIPTSADLAPALIELKSKGWSKTK